MISPRKATLGRSTKFIFRKATAIAFLGGGLALPGVAVAQDLNVPAGETHTVSGTETYEALAGAGDITFDTGATRLVVQSGDFSGTITNQGVSWGPSTAFVVNGAAADTLTFNGATVAGGAMYVENGGLVITQGDAAVDYLAIGTGTSSGVANVGGLEISGGTLRINVALQVGDWGGTGTVNQTGGTVTVEAGCDDASHCVSMNIGNQGGNGTYNISGGKLELVGGLHSLGRNAGGNPAGNGTLNISGDAVVELRPNPNFDGQTPSQSFGNGSLIIGDRSGGGDGESTGVINQTGGTFRVMADSLLFVGGHGHGTYNLNGGALEIGGNSLLGPYQNPTGTYDFNLGGGTIRVIGSKLVTSVDAELVGGTTSTIDTNGFGADWNGILSGDGALRKTGDGALTLFGANTYTGGTILDGGILGLGNDQALGTGGLTVNGSTSTIAYNDGVDIANAITLQGDVALDVSSGLAAQSGAVGEAGGSFGINKTGPGVLTLNGANTYTGVTRISAGTLALGINGSIESSMGVDLSGSGAVFNITAVDKTIQDLTGVSGSMVELGVNTLTLGSERDSTFAGIIDGDGGINKVGTGVLTLSGENGYFGTTTISEGTLRLGVDNAFSGANTDVIVQSGAVFDLDGYDQSIGDLTNSGIVSPGLGTLSTSHATFNAGGTYVVTVDGLTSTSSLISAESAELAGNVAVEFASAPAEGTFEILNTTFHYTDTFNPDVEVHSAFYDAALSYDGDLYGVDLTISRNGISFVDIADTPNQSSVAGVLEGLGSGPLYDTILALNEAEARQAYDLFSGEIHASTTTILTQIGQTIGQLLANHLQGPFGEPSGGSGPLGYAGDAGLDFRAPVETTRLWGQGFGDWSEISDPDDNSAELEADTAGFFAGIDHFVSPSTLIGLAGGYSTTDTEADDRDSSGSLDSAYLAAYGGTEIGAVALRFGGVYGWSDVETTREVVVQNIDETLTADYAAETGQVFGEIGYRTLFGQTMVEPYAGLSYVHVSTDGFTEEGGDAALTVSSEDDGTVFSALGVRSTTRMIVGESLVTAHGGIAWRHSFDDSAPTSTMAFDGSAPFTISGVPAASDLLVVDGGLAINPTRNTTLGVYYSGQFGEDVISNQLRGEAVVRF